MCRNISISPQCSTIIQLHGTVDDRWRWLHRPGGTPMCVPPDTYDTSHATLQVNDSFPCSFIFRRAVAVAVK